MEVDVIYVTKMINISNIVEEIINEDDVALKSIREGYMNFSSYARIIQNKVSERSFKPVGEKSIVVALARIAGKISKTSEREVKILNLSVHSNLSEISFEKSTDNLKLLHKLLHDIPEDTKSYFTNTAGLTEITIIGEDNIITLAQKIFEGKKPLFLEKNLTGLTVKFDINYLDEANVMYKIFTKLAVKDINIIEVVSTTTELTFLIEKRDTEVAVKQLSKLL